MTSTLSELREAVLALKYHDHEAREFHAGVKEAASLIAAYEQQAAERAAVLAGEAKALAQRFSDQLHYAYKHGDGHAGHLNNAFATGKRLGDAINKLATLAGGKDAN